MPLKTLEFLKNHWRAFLMVLLSAGFYVAGSMSHPAQTKLVYQDKIVEKETQVAKITDQNHKVTTITKAKDGTVTETIVDNSLITKDMKSTESKTEDKTITKTAEATIAQHNYSLGLAFELQPKLSLNPNDFRPTYRIEGGKRLLGDLWLGVSYNVQDTRFGLGIRYDF